MMSHLDIIQYDPVHSNMTCDQVLAIKQRLPPEIKVRLFKKATYTSAYVYGGGYSICVETADKEVQARLDDLLQIKEGQYFIKTRYVEVSRRLLDQYPFYYISPHCYEQERRIFFELKRPTCRSWEMCPAGYARTSPVRIHPKVVPSLGIGRIGAAWELDVNLLLSADVKRLFEDFGITGLVYEPCEVGTKRQKQNMPETAVYLARIEPRIYESADDIAIGSAYCPEHQVVGFCTLFNARIPYSRLGKEDFQVINRVRVRETEYVYQTPRWVVSSRVVKLLLDRRIKGLRLCTCMLKEKFWPLVNLE